MIYTIIAAGQNWPIERTSMDRPIMMPDHIKYDFLSFLNPIKKSRLPKRNRKKKRQSESITTDNEIEVNDVAERIPATQPTAPDPVSS